MTAASEPQDEPIRLVMDDFYDLTPAVSAAKVPIEVKPATPSPVPAPIKTLDPEFDRILKQREAEIPAPAPAPIPKEPAEVPQKAPQPQFKDSDIAEVVEYERRHPEYFPAGTTLEKKIETLKKNGKVQADEKMNKQASFKALDIATEKKALEIETTKTEEVPQSQPIEVLKPQPAAPIDKSEPDPKISDGNIISLPDIEGEDGGEFEPGQFKFTPGTLNELGNSMQFVNEYKDRCKFSYDSKRWYVWDNAQRWKPNHIGKVTRWGKSIVKRLYGYAVSISPVTVADKEFKDAILKHAARSSTKHGVTNLLDLAKSDIECSELDFDKDGYLLNLKDCTLDLRTGEHHEQTSDDMLSKLAGVKYDPDAMCPKWEDHISKVFDKFDSKGNVVEENEKLILNFQEICGYVLAGAGNPSAAFFVLYGSGRNGKSVTLNVLTHILGEYAVNIAPQSLQPMKPGQIRSDLMPTKGARVITCTEPGKGMKIDDGLIKSMTGGDQITARELYGDPISFSISGCLFLATNHKPRVSDQSTAMWTRIWMIPFKHYFDPTSPNSDPDIEKKLRKEASGILNWCIAGWKRYQETGKLVKSKAISDETNEYQNQEDFLYDFLYQKKADGELVYTIDIHNRAMYIPAAELYTAYKQWCSMNNIRPMSNTTFGREISSRFEKVHTRKGNVYLGIRIAGAAVQTELER